MCSEKGARQETHRQVIRRALLSRLLRFRPQRRSPLREEIPKRLRGVQRIADGIGWSDMQQRSQKRSARAFSAARPLVPRVRYADEFHVSTPRTGPTLDVRHAVSRNKRLAARICLLPNGERGGYGAERLRLWVIHAYAAVERDMLVVQSVNLHNGRTLRVRARIRIERSRYGTDGGDRKRRFTCQAVCHHSPVRHTRYVHASRIGVLRSFDRGYHCPDERNVVDITLLRRSAAQPGTPTAADAVRVGDEEASALRKLVPPVIFFGLHPRTVTAVKHDDQRRAIALPHDRRAIKVIRAIESTRKQMKRDGKRRDEHARFVSRQTARRQMSAAGLTESSSRH